MPTVTVILGLSGSGKSEYLKMMNGVQKFEEGVLPGLPNWCPFLDALALGKDCAIIEIAYIRGDARGQLVRYLRERYPDTTVKWVCFKNDLKAANWNCRNDPNRPKERAEGNVLLNGQWTLAYTIPEGAIILDIFPLPPLDR